MTNARPFGRTIINPDDFLNTPNGRVWTVERNEAAWIRSYDLLADTLGNRGSVCRVRLVCGLQGSGKTTWIAAQPSSATIIYFDAALPAMRHRAPIVAIAKRYAVPIDAVWIKVPVDLALERNARRAPDIRVPAAAIHAVLEHFEQPTTAEGFDGVTIVDVSR